MQTDNKREVGLGNTKTKRSRKMKKLVTRPETRGDTGGQHRVASRRKTEQNGPGHENKNYIHEHTKEGMRNRWSEEGKVQVEVKEQKNTGRREKHTEEELKSKMRHKISK